MAGGWTRDGAIQDQIDADIADAVSRARRALGDGQSGGEGRADCEECGEAIPAARRAAVPGVRFCVACQAERDEARGGGAFNRRGSKGSQMR